MLLALVALFAGAVGSVPTVEPEHNVRISVGDTSKPRAPLPGASVSVVPVGGGPEVQGPADARGALGFDLVPGAYRVTVSLTGFKRQSRVIAVGPGARLAAEFRMKLDHSAETVLIDDTCAFDHLAELGSWRICAHDLGRLPGH